MMRLMGSKPEVAGGGAVSEGVSARDRHHETGKQGESMQTKVVKVDWEG